MGGLQITEDHFGWAPPEFEAKMPATAEWAALQSGAAVKPEGEAAEGQAAAGEGKWETEEGADEEEGAD